MEEDIADTLVSLSGLFIRIEGDTADTVDNISCYCFRMEGDTADTLTYIRMERDYANILDS